MVANPGGDVGDGGAPIVVSHRAATPSCVIDDSQQKQNAYNMEAEEATALGTVTR
jgi:hypothetical protein